MISIMQSSYYYYYICLPPQLTSQLPCVNRAPSRGQVTQLHQRVKCPVSSKCNQRKVPWHTIEFNMTVIFYTSQQNHTGLKFRQFVSVSQDTEDQVIVVLNLKLVQQQTFYLFTTFFYLIAPPPLVNSCPVQGLSQYYDDDDDDDRDREI